MKLFAQSLIVIGLLLIEGCAHQSKPIPPIASALLIPSHPTCAELATVANHFIKLGESATVTELTHRWNAARTEDARESELREQIGWVFRLVYTARPNTVLRRPYFGGQGMPLDEFRDHDWPFYPLIEADGVFFLLAEGYTLAGLAEDPLDYLAYCRANGVFRRERLAVPSEEEATRALNAFLETSVCKKVKWKEFGPGFEAFHEPLPGFLYQQTKARAQLPSSK